MRTAMKVLPLLPFTLMQSLSFFPFLTDVVFFNLAPLETKKKRNTKKKHARSLIMRGEQALGKQSCNTAKACVYFAVSSEIKALL